MSALLERVRLFFAKLLDGPVRTRTFWTLVIGSVLNIAVGGGLAPEVAADWQTQANAVLLALVAIGALSGTTGTTEITDPSQKGW